MKFLNLFNKESSVLTEFSNVLYEQRIHEIDFVLYCCLKEIIFLPVTRVREFPVFYIHVEMWIYIFSQILIMEWAYQRISNWTKYSKSTWRVCSALHPSAWELSSSWGVVLFRANHEIIETHTNYLVISCLKGVSLPSHIGFIRYSLFAQQIFIANFSWMLTSK